MLCIIQLAVPNFFITLFATEILVCKNGGKECETVGILEDAYSKIRNIFSIPPLFVYFSMPYCSCNVL